MPIFTVITNIPQANISESFLKQLSSAVASVLNRPEAYTTVHAIGDQKVLFGGTSEPAVQATIKSIDDFGPAENNKIAAALFPLIAKELGVSPKRVFLEFVNIDKTALAHNGATFEHIL